MPRTTSITLTQHFERFIADQMATGRYGSTSEIVREALRLMETREEKLTALRAAVDVGIAELDRGEGVGYSTRELKDELLK